MGRGDSFFVNLCMCESSFVNHPFNNDFRNVLFLRFSVINVALLTQLKVYSVTVLSLYSIPITSMDFSFASVEHTIWLLAIFIVHFYVCALAIPSGSYVHQCCFIDTRQDFSVYSSGWYLVTRIVLVFFRSHF